MIRYRVTVFGEPRGEWRDSRAAAMEDAVLLQLASWDQSRREYYVAVPVEIEERRQAPDEEWVIPPVLR